MKVSEEIKQAIKNYRRDGHSYNDIKSLLKIVPKSTIIHHCKNVSILNKDRIQNKLKAYYFSLKTFNKSAIISKEKWKLAKKSIAQEAIIEFKKLKHNPDFMLFLGLYWGEGNKRSNTVGLANTNPAIIKIAYNYFSKLTTKKIVLNVTYYPDHDKTKLKATWSKFVPCIIKMIDITKYDTRIGKKKHAEYGIARLEISDWKLRTKILTWLKLLEQATLV